jgi:hypothetical protein
MQRNSPEKGIRTRWVLNVDNRAVSKKKKKLVVTYI